MEIAPESTESACTYLTTLLHAIQYLNLFVCKYNSADIKVTVNLRIHSAGRYPPIGNSLSHLSNMDNKTEVTAATLESESFNEYLWIRITFVFFMIALSVAGFVGNTLIIVAIIFVPELRSTQNAFLINLAVSDLMLILIVVPFNILSVVHGKLFWEDRMPLCIFVASVCAPGCLSAIWSNTGTAFNRICLNQFQKAAASNAPTIVCAVTFTAMAYFFMCRNDVYNQLFSKFKTVLWILAIWAISFLIHMPNHIGWGQNGYAEEFYLCTRETNLWTYSTFFAVVGIVLPIAISFFSYWNIYLLVRRTKSARNIIIKLRKSAAPLKTVVSASSTGATETLVKTPLVPRKSKTSIVVVTDGLTGQAKQWTKNFCNEILLAQTLLRSFVLFLVSWLPLAILLMLPAYPIPTWINLGSILLAHGNTATNSILIYSSDKRFRYGLLSLYRKCVNREGFAESRVGFVGSTPNSRISAK